MCVARENDKPGEYGLASMYQASCWSSCSGPSWKSARIRSYTGHASEGYWGHQFSDALGKTISPSLLFLSQTSVGKRSWRLHRVSPDCEHFVLIHAAWDAGFIGLISKLRPRPPCRTPHTMRAILLASAIASLKRLSRRAAASIQDLRPCFSQLCGRRLLAAFHDFAPPAPVAPRP